MTAAGRRAQTYWTAIRADGHKSALLVFAVELGCGSPDSVGAPVVRDTAEPLPPGAVPRGPAWPHILGPFGGPDCEDTAAPGSADWTGVEWLKADDATGAVRADPIILSGAVTQGTTFGSVPWFTCLLGEPLNFYACRTADGLASLASDVGVTLTVNAGDVDGDGLDDLGVWGPAIALSSLMGDPPWIRAVDRVALFDDPDSVLHPSFGGTGDEGLGVRTAVFEAPQSPPLDGAIVLIDAPFSPVVTSEDARLTWVPEAANDYIAGIQWFFDARFVGDYDGDGLDDVAVQGNLRWGLPYLIVPCDCAAADGPTNAFDDAEQEVRVVTAAWMSGVMTTEDAPFSVQLDIESHGNSREVEGLGDVDGDGLDDIAIGSTIWFGGQDGVGKCITEDASVRVDLTEEELSPFGDDEYSTVAPAILRGVDGQVDAVAVVSGPEVEEFEERPGRVYVFAGVPLGVVQPIDADWFIQAEPYLGYGPSYAYPDPEGGDLLGLYRDGGYDLFDLEGLHP